jgi:hypothetical protein
MAGAVSALGRLSLGAVLALGLAAAANAAPARVGANSPAAAKAWTDIGALPDWGGTWEPDRANEAKELAQNKPPWNAKAQAIIDFQTKESAAGRPVLVLWGCFPHGTPSWMMINHNLMEILFTPGRVTMLGEVDGNRMRRVYTDGRPHPEDPDLSFHGHSIGKWEGDTLVIDTVGIAPQAPIAQSESIGISNNGDMHVVERMRLTGPDTLEDKITITAPKVFTKTWTATSYYKRLRGPINDIYEGQCIRGDYDEGVDKDGNATFVPSAIERENGGTKSVKQ